MLYAKYIIFLASYVTLGNRQEVKLGLIRYSTGRAKTGITDAPVNCKLKLHIYDVYTSVRVSADNYWH